MRSNKSRMLLAAGLVGAVVAAAGAAWACTVSAQMGQLSPSSGAAGTKTRVSGENFRRGVVQIHWNSSDGPVLATTTGPSFSVSVIIPGEAGPGTYYVVAVSRRVDGSIAGKASAPFTVKPLASSQSDAAGPTRSTQTAGSTSGADGSQAEDAGEETSVTASAEEQSQEESDGQAVTSASAGESRGEGRPQRAVTSTTANAGDSSGKPISAGPGEAAAPADRRVSQPAAPVAQVTATRSDGRVFGPSVGPARESLSPGRQRSASSGPAVQPAPPPAAAADDLWSGFQTDGSGSAIPALGPETLGQQGTERTLAVGASLLGAGLLTLMASFMVAVVRRRRAVARS